MSKRRIRRARQRAPSPGAARWRTVGIITTTVVGVTMLMVVSFTGIGRRAADRGPHDHPPGPHGGTVVAVDRDNQVHAETVFEPDGTVRLYTFGRDTAAPQPATAGTVSAAVRGHEPADEYAVMLRPEPQPFDPPGTASRFVGRTPPAAWGGHLKLVVWALPLDGQRYLFEVDTPGVPADEAAAARAASVEAALYGTPGGSYAAADIRANGERPASRKYRGSRAAHDDRPAPGDRVCPVSGKTADQRFVWVVAGNSYLFCCPPCIDEFVSLAKERPGEIQGPDFYRR